MDIEVLEPRLELLRQEHVLVQAWKKTASHIRHHNWYSDTLELDRVAINLPEFLSAVGDALASPTAWTSGLLRMVPAPKSQRWGFTRRREWGPIESGTNKTRLRPLAHVELQDQVVATAVMLCIANRVETLQGDPRVPITANEDRRRVISYGNRLFCDSEGNQLAHRWGSAKLYRAYYQDYRRFLFRPEVVAASIQPAPGRRSYILHSDLRQFYDRVKPQGLAAALSRIQQEEDDPSFFEFAARLFDWTWHPKDQGEVAMYAKQAELHDFSRVALPQGLVSAGFFANVALLEFDEKMRGAIGSEVIPGITLEDGCRYVDDLRIVVTSLDNDLAGADGLSAIKMLVSKWLQEMLTSAAPGLLVSAEKTKAAEVGGVERPLIRQSAKMNRIQAAVSGGFDAVGGAEILDAIQGLVRSQETMSLRAGEDGWALSPLPDVRDETVARFAAARFRTTYRSIRPLLEGYDDVSTVHGLHESGDEPPRAPHLITQNQLDADARAFAMSLIERWVFDPSNVRLLRIGLDLWPDAEVLEGVLALVRPFTEKGGRRKGPRRVAWYCLSEILRAGATETGLVGDEQALPESLDLVDYRRVLVREAARLIQLPTTQIPWYLRQQALLFLATASPDKAPLTTTGRSAQFRHYRGLIRLLRGDGVDVNSKEFATLAVLARRSFSTAANAASIVRENATAARIREIAARDGEFVRELLEDDDFPISADELSARVREDLCLDAGDDAENITTLAEIVLGAELSEPVLRDELSILRFADAFLRKWRQLTPALEVITPSQVHVEIDTKSDMARVSDVDIRPSRASTADSLYSPPRWCDGANRWRFHLGFLLRFILSRSPEFTRNVRPSSWKESDKAYRPAQGHWRQRLFGLFNGQQAFGDDWLPITDWFESFLSALLHWPGCRTPEGFAWIGEGIGNTLGEIRGRIAFLEGKRGNATGTLMLPLVARRPTSDSAARPLRICVVQTVIPRDSDFNVSDLTLSNRSFRRVHRKHLSAALAAVERMLHLRETHEERDGRLDWLILPELSVHPRDVDTHLIPFARKHKTLILAGLTYEELFIDKPLVNSALWVIPEWSSALGLQMRTRRQGKRYLASSEENFNKPTALVSGFRPCQWLIGYPWTSETGVEPLWLTASVCYDATDIRLAADLSRESDVFAIPALNRDVNTFDQMALALHYHMYQLVVVANNGQFGGSNAYWPNQEPLNRRVFHLHGQPQASVAFLEIDDIQKFLARRNPSMSDSLGTSDSSMKLWKHPPAGITDR